MQVTCYGPRGSLPAPSRAARGNKPAFTTTEYGGNTSCYYVEAGPFRVILDAGSGISVLGDDLMKAGLIGKHFLFFLSHYHWDHIQGLPFSVPFFIAPNVFHIHGFTPDGEEGPCPRTPVEKMLAEQQSSPHFPVPHESLPASRGYYAHSWQFSETLWYVHFPKGAFTGTGENLQPGAYDLTFEDPATWGAGEDDWRDTPDPEDVLKITTIPLNHPNGCLSYRIEHQGKVFVYATDHEPARHTWARLNNLGKGCDLAVLDGQYTEAQIAAMTQGFGHGTPRSCIEQALAMDARHILIHHHDPKHDDTKVAEMEADSLVYARDTGFAGKVEFSREGVTYGV